jgi:hypothetical protein
MKIKREGTQRYNGITSIELKDPCFEWNSHQKQVEFSKHKIKDFTSDSNHDYTVQFELSEIAEVLNLIAGEVIKQNPEHLIKELSPVTVKILKILTVLANAPEPTEDE